MGTRNIIMVLHGGEYKVAQYAQWDGYPSGQGVTVLEFLQKMDIEKMRGAIEQTSFVSEDDLEKINKSTDSEGKIDGVSWKQKYPSLSRDIGADILDLVYYDPRVKLNDSINFVADGLFCEWGYLVNLDDETFEIYQGFGKSPLDESDRFFFMTDKALKESAASESTYYPIKIVKSYPLSELPSEEDFISYFENNDD